ncbi:hypothetical protein MKX03_031624 [Papaver bracteatum]|nr:hypothetical protein MKX03_031624 [Papaver bracteatum]
METNSITKKLLNEDNEIEVDENLRSKLLVESKKLWVVAGPAIFTRFSTFGISIISQVFIGHMGSTELAAYSLVFTVLIRFANDILLGMASALETLCGQAYGAKQYDMLGIYLQRSWIVLFITSLFLFPFFPLTSPILKLLGQEEDIADVAGIFALWTIPIMFSFICSFTCQMYLSAQIIAYWIPNVGQLLFVTCGGCPETWSGFSMLAFQDLWPVIKLSMSSDAMLCVRVFNELGGGSSKGAKFAILVSTLTSLTIGVMLFVFFLFFKGKLAYIFTTDEAVAIAVDGLAPLLAFSILLNSVQPVLSWVAVGAGWQSIVAYVNIGCYYLVGIPIGMALGYLINLQVRVALARDRVRRWGVHMKEKNPFRTGRACNVELHRLYNMHTLHGKNVV